MCIMWSCETWYTIVVTYPRNSKYICICICICTMYHLWWDILTYKWPLIKQRNAYMLAKYWLYLRPAGHLKNYSRQMLTKQLAHHMQMSWFEGSRHVYKHRESLILISVLFFDVHLVMHAWPLHTCMTGWAVKSDTMYNIAGVLNVIIK
jgi:hypothetical protein